MATESVPDPAVVDSADLASPAPEPGDCVPPCEQPRSVAELSPGWVALTDRELLVYHPDREPPVGRSLRANVTGVTVRRAGARHLLGYVPVAALYAVAGVVVGLLLVAVDPTGFLAVPEGSPIDALGSVVRGLERATNLLGAVLALTGVIAGLGVVVVVAYWLGSSDVTLVVERGGGADLECPTTLPAGRRAVRSLRAAFDDGPGPGNDADPGDDAATFDDDGPGLTGDDTGVADDSPAGDGAGPARGTDGSISSRD